MALESTIICVDNSEYMRNGDFRPTRLQAQQEAVGYVCQAKIQSHPQNNVGLLTLAHPEVLSTLTSDVARVISKLHQVQPNGDINFVSAVRIAHMVLKHRLGRSHRMRIVVFVGSPVETDLKDLTKLAKSLKKEKVSVDIVNFGEDAANTEKLSAFISTLNGEDGTSSHLVTVPSGDQTHLSDVLISSPVIQGEGGAGGIGSGSGGFEFGIDPNEDPELALALRVSMEEQRQQQEAAARRAMAESAMETDEAAHANQAAEPISSEERLLQQALAMSMETETTPTTTAATNLPDFSAMTEEEQIAYAVQMSIQQTETDSAASGEQKSAPAAEAKSEPKPEKKKEEKPEEKKEDKTEQKKEHKKEEKAEDKKGENEGEKKEEKKEDTKEERKEEKKPEQKQVEEAKN